MSMAGEFRTILARKAQSLPAKIISVQNLSCQRSDVNLHMQVVTAESQVEMNLSQLLGEKLGYVPMMSITNPSYPLSFERYGDGNLDDDPEFKNEVRELVGRGRRDIPSCCSEWGAEEEVYSNKRIFRAESKARAAYGAVDPVNEARAALAISVNSPEAYNVLAIKAATTYEEALEYYNKAVAVGPEVSHDFDQAVSNGEAWERNQHRSYFRAVHGQANTLRKMGRYREALAKYMKLAKMNPGFHSWSSYANWRYHVLETYMKAGDNEGARKFALKKVNKEAFGLASSATAWYWSFALLDYKLKRCSGWADDYFLIFDEENHYGHDKIVGAIIRAITASPSMISFLTGNRKLPNCPIPYEMGNEASLTNVANYYMSNKELWESTPGAIEWACTNARTFFSLLFLQGDKKGCKQLKIPCTFENYKAMVEEGIYVNATIKHGKKIIHEAMSSRQPGNLKVLVDAGASVLPTLLFGVPQPIHMACYYNSSPEMIKILVDAGANPSEKYGMHYSPLQMAGEQGAADALEFAISCLPKKKQKDKRVMEDVLKAVFTNSCYECINGMGPKCVRCIHETTPHPKNASHTRCIDAVLATGYKPSRQYIRELRNMMIDTKIGLLQYLIACTETEIDSSKAKSKLGTGQKPAAKKPICKVCKKGDMKLSRCSRCHDVRYCSKACQQADWKEHKKICGGNTK